MKTVALLVCVLLAVPVLGQDSNRLKNDINGILDRRSPGSAPTSAEGIRQDMIRTFKPLQDEPDGRERLSDALSSAITDLRRDVVEADADSLERCWQRLSGVLAYVVKGSFLDEKGQENVLLALSPRPADLKRWRRLPELPNDEVHRHLLCLAALHVTGRDFAESVVAELARPYIELSIEKQEAKIFALLVEEWPKDLRLGRFRKFDSPHLIGHAARKLLDTSAYSLGIWRRYGALLDLNETVPEPIVSALFRESLEKRKINEARKHAQALVEMGNTQTQAAWTTFEGVRGKVIAQQDRVFFADAYRWLAELAPDFDRDRQRLAKRVDEVLRRRPIEAGELQSVLGTAHSIGVTPEVLGDVLVTVFDASISEERQGVRRGLEHIAALDSTPQKAVSKFILAVMEAGDWELARGATRSLQPSLTSVAVSRIQRALDSAVAARIQPERETVWFYFEFGAQMGLVPSPDLRAYLQSEGAPLELEFRFHNALARGELQEAAGVGAQWIGLQNDRRSSVVKALRLSLDRALRTPGQLDVSVVAGAAAALELVRQHQSDINTGVEGLLVDRLRACLSAPTDRLDSELQAAQRLGFGNSQRIRAAYESVLFERLLRARRFQEAVGIATGPSGSNLMVDRLLAAIVARLRAQQGLRNDECLDMARAIEPLRTQQSIEPLRVAVAERLVAARTSSRERRVREIQFADLAKLPDRRGVVDALLSRSDPDPRRDLQLSANALADLAAVFGADPAVVSAASGFFQEAVRAEFLEGVLQVLKDPVLAKSLSTTLAKTLDDSLRNSRQISFVIRLIAGIRARNVATIDVDDGLLLARMQDEFERPFLDVRMMESTLDAAVTLGLPKSDQLAMRERILSATDPREDAAVERRVSAYLDVHDGELSSEVAAMVFDVLQRRRQWSAAKAWMDVALEAGKLVETDARVTAVRREEARWRRERTFYENFNHVGKWRATLHIPDSELRSSPFEIRFDGVGGKWAKIAKSDIFEPAARCILDRQARELKVYFSEPKTFHPELAKRHWWSGRITRLDPAGTRIRWDLSTENEETAVFIELQRKR